MLTAARWAVRVSPIGSTRISSRFFDLFRRRCVTTFVGRRLRIPILPGVHACWRDAVQGREWGPRNFLLRQSRRATGFLDCGANMGPFSLLFAAANRQARVIAVEPLAECCRYLRAARRLNGLSGLEILQAVLSARSGRVPFHRPVVDFDEGGQIDGAGNATTTCLTEVQAYSLNDLLARYGPGDRVVIKIDIEGHEARAFDASVEKENAAKVLAVCVEVHLALYARPWENFADWFSRLEGWFKADWWICAPGGTGPASRRIDHRLRRYVRRLFHKEGLERIDHNALRKAVQTGAIEEFHLLGAAKRT